MPDKRRRADRLARLVIAELEVGEALLPEADSRWQALHEAKGHVRRAEQIAMGAAENARDKGARDMAAALLAAIPTGYSRIVWSDWKHREVLAAVRAAAEAQGYSNA